MKETAKAPAPRTKPVIDQEYSLEAAYVGHKILLMDDLRGQLHTLEQEIKGHQAKQVQLRQELLSLSVQTQSAPMESA